MSSRDPIFETYLSHTYSAVNDLSEESLQSSVENNKRKLGPWLPADREGPILELGCGIGSFLQCCLDLGYKDVEGVDIAEQQVAACRRRKLPAVQGEALDYLSKSSKRYAAIVASDLLEHLPKPDVIPFLRVAAERLRDDGRIILRVPNLSNPMNLRTRYVDFTHECGFTSESLAQVMRVAGLHVTQIDGDYSLHRNLLARVFFDVFLWKLFRVFCRETLRLKSDPIRGKNLVAVGMLPQRAPQ